jgi:hypothetical protein
MPYQDENWEQVVFGMWDLFLPSGENASHPWDHPS